MNSNLSQKQNDVLNEDDIDISNMFTSNELYGTQSSNTAHVENKDGVVSFTIHPALAVGLVGAFLANSAIILSLPPVIRGKGAPFLPTFKKGMETMFRQLRKQPQIKRKIIENQEINFVDLGSGDGRVVFRAAREGIFHKCIGYEINPVLHAWATTRRLLQASRYFSTTDFALRDLWKVNLEQVDVVAVYGLHPIMNDLGKKLGAELRPGSLVVSNVFAIPGWKPVDGSTDGVHIYSIPECLGFHNGDNKACITSNMQIVNRNSMTNDSTKNKHQVRYN